MLPRFTLCYLACLFIAGCGLIPPLGTPKWIAIAPVVIGLDTDQPMVYRDEYILEAHGPWCPLLTPGVPQEPCEGLPAGVYSLEGTGGGTRVVLVKTTLRGLSVESEVVPYDEDEDWCKSPNLKGRNCSPNFVVHTSTSVTTKDHPSLSKLWGLERIQAPEAWTLIDSAPSVRVAVLDTGIEANHPDLNVILEKNLITGANNGFDENGHGTHVAGTICGATTGVAHSCSLLAGKFLGTSGGGSLFHAIKGIEWAIENGASIINASWGCRGCYSAPLYSAIKRAADANILFVAAAGNNGVDNDNTTHHYPSDYNLPNIISVAAIKESGELAYFSNYGKISVDIAAPGYDTHSTCPGKSYCTKSGTSMATPHIAGSLALLMAKGFSRREAAERILKYGTPNNALRTRSVTGTELNLRQAISGEKPKVPKGKLATCRKRCEKRWKRERRLRRCRRHCKKLFRK